MGLNRAVQAKLESLALTDPLTRRVRIHASSFPNSCGQHHIADIGFHGAAIKSGTRQVPAYHVVLGGACREDTLRYGRLLKLRVPAKRVPEVVERFVGLYERERAEDEEFSAFADRVGKDPFEAVARDLALPPEFSPETVPLFVDWDRTGIYVLERREGECAV